MNRPGRAWKALLGCATGVFTSPSFALFCELMTAWACTTARRSIVQMVGVMDPASRAAHDAYHRLVRAGAWSLARCFEALCKLVVASLLGPGRIVLYLDDTLFHRNGPKVEGAASWRDAVRPTKKRVVYARGLNLVVLCVAVTPPWGGMTIAIPVNLRLHRKDGPTMPALAREMMADLASWLPERSFVLCGDGAYATLAGDHLERTTVVSRMRRDAALYEAPPLRTGKAGRPRKRGARLPTAVKLAQAATGFKKVELDWRGRRVTKLVWSREVLWYRVCPDALVRLVVVRDPAGKEPDDFFFSTDLAMSAAEVVEIYAGRWSRCATGRSSKRSGAKSPSPGRTKDPSAPPGSRSGSTAPCGSGTSRSAGAIPASGSSRGIRRSKPPRSLTRWPSCVERYGANGFIPLRVLPSWTSKQSMYWWRHSPWLHRGYHPISASATKLRKSTTGDRAPTTCCASRR